MDYIDCEERNKIIKKFYEYLEQSTNKEIVISTIKIEKKIRRHFRKENLIIEIFQNYKSLDFPDVHLDVECNQFGQLILTFHDRCYELKRSKFFKIVHDEIVNRIILDKNNIDDRIKREEEKRIRNEQETKRLQSLLDFEFKLNNGESAEVRMPNSRVSFKIDNNNKVRLTHLHINDELTIEHLKSLVKIIKESSNE